MSKVSIIIRTKNEEEWISHCLDMVYRQSFTDFEVILVDNESTDHTVEIARRYPLSRIISIDRFFPGLALNKGIRASKGEYIVCLSAHCVPKGVDWLENLLANFSSEENLAGAYGRQLPVSFTDPVDKRDLLITFGRDRRLQTKDYFFHNANSILRRDIWEKFPFDEKATNIEDRIWGKKVTENGYQIAYDPEASVYHYHGLHQGNVKDRVEGVVSIIEEVDHDVANQLPNGLRPESIRISAIIPVDDSVNFSSKSEELLLQTINSLSSSKFLDNIYIVSNQSDLAYGQTSWIDRGEIENIDNLGLDEIMQKSLEVIESREEYPSLLFYINYDYLHRIDNLIDELIIDRQYKGYNTVFAGYIDYGHYWLKGDDGQFFQSDSLLNSREEREPAYAALYGQGCLTSATNIRKGQLIFGKIGIFPVDDFKYTLRARRSNKCR